MPLKALFTFVLVFTLNLFLFSKMNHAFAQEETETIESPIYTTGSILHGSRGAGSSSAANSPQKVQTAILASLRTGDYARAKALLKTPGGRSILKTAPDYQDRIEKYIEAAIQKEMMAVRYLNTDELQKMMNGQLFEIARIGNDFIRRQYINKLSAENIQERIQSSLQRVLKKQIEEFAAAAMTDERRTELEKAVKERFQRMDKAALEERIKNRFKNMSELEREQFLKKHINEVIRKRIREALKTEMQEVRDPEFMALLKDNLEQITTPVAEGIRERNVRVMTQAMNKDGRLTELFENVDKSQIVAIFRNFDENQLGAFSNLLNLDVSPLASKFDLSKAISNAEPQALERLIKGMDEPNRDIFMRALLQADLSSYIRKTFNAKIKDAVIENLSKNKRQN